MASAPIALILGSGPRIGAASAKKFAAAGYKVAVVSRNGTGATTPEGYLSLKADFSKPESIPAVFDAVKKEFQAAPTVVVYNAATLTPPPAQDSIFSVPAENFASDLTVNTVSAYVAAQEAVKGWQSLAKDAKKTFILTGNALNAVVIPMPLFFTLGVGKSASGSFIGLADTLYSAQGSRFFYADERHENGMIKGGELDGEANAEFFVQLATHSGNIPWAATFVKGKGYVEFK